MNTLVDLARSIDKCEVVLVHEMLEDKINKSKGSDEGTGDAVHDNHGKKEQHPRILLTKSVIL